MFSFAAATAEWLHRADRHRNGALAMVLLVTCVEAAFGMPVQPIVFVVFGVWLSLGLLVARVMRRVHGSPREPLLRALVFLGDIVALAILLHVSGGTAWYGRLPVRVRHHARRRRLPGAGSPWSRR
jgi:hypothetical protein